MLQSNIINKVGSTYQLNEDQITQLSNSKVVEVLVNLPFEAGCNHPEKTAIQSLGLYITAHKNQAFDEKPGEGFFTRCFDGINLYQRGDQGIIKKGLSILEFLSLEDHYQDRKIDLKAGKYNPINAGILAYRKAKEKILNTINQVKNQVLDNILNDKTRSGNWMAPESKLYKTRSNTWMAPESELYKTRSNTWMAPESELYKTRSNTWMAPESEPGM